MGNEDISKTEQRVLKYKHILEHVLPCRPETNLERLLENLKREKDEDGYLKWVESGRLVQAMRVAIICPEALPAYFAYEFKGEGSRIDELKAIDNLLDGNWWKTVPDLNIQVQVEYPTNQRQKEAMKEFTETLRAIYQLMIPTEIVYNYRERMTRIITHLHKTGGDTSWMTDNPEFEKRAEKTSFEEAVAEFAPPGVLEYYQSLIEKRFSDQVKSLKHRRTRPNLGEVVEGLARINLMELVTDSTSSPPPAAQPFKSITDFFDFEKIYDMYQRMECQRTVMRMLRRMGKRKKSEVSKETLAEIEKAAEKEVKVRFPEKCRFLMPNMAADLIAYTITRIIMNNASDERLEPLVDRLCGMYEAVTESAFDSISAEINPQPIDNLCDGIDACISGEGKEREAAIVYSLQSSGIDLISLNAYFHEQRRGAIAKAIVVDAEDMQHQSQEVILVDGVIASPIVEKLRRSPYEKSAPDWKRVMYEAIVKYTLHMSLSGRIVVNISHGTAQQSIHDFVMYVAKLRGLKRGEHYTFRREQGTRVFRLTPKGVVNLGGRRAPNGLYYTHQLKRRSHFQSCNRDLELANDRFNGEAYLDAWFLNDASEFFQEVKRECRLRTNNPEEILQFVKSDPQLAAELEKKGFNWTKGEGYIIGIEMSAKPTRTDEGCEEGYGHYDGFFGEEQETRGDSSCVNRCKDDDGDIPEDDIPF